MIGEAPLAAAANLDTLQQQVSAFCTVAKLKAADGLTLAEFSELTLSAIRLGIAAVDSVPADGAAKKALVLDVVGHVFDQFADRVIPFPLLPIWWMTKPAIRQIVLALGSGAVESMLPLLRNSK